MQPVPDITNQESSDNSEPITRTSITPFFSSKKSRLKILYFYQYFGTPKGAWSTRVYEFGQRWVNAGHQVTVVTSVYDKSDLRPDKLISRFDCDGIDVVVLNIRLSNRHGFLFRLWTFAAYATLSSWYALSLPADVIVASSGPITAAIPGLIGRFLKRRPLVFEVRDLWPEGAVQLGIIKHSVLIRTARAFEKLCYRSASRIVALSDGMASWIRRQYGFENVAVVPNASDNELFDRLDEPPALPDWAQDKFLVVYTGSIGVANDCAQILDTAESLQRCNADGVEIVILGDGVHRDQLTEEALSRGLNNIRFLGIVSRDEWRHWLRQSGCVLVVYKRGFMDTASPNKLFDAFAAGAPVVQTTEGWIKDLLAREDCGLSVPPERPEQMANAILSLLKDSELRERIRRNSRRVGRELFGRDLLSARMLGVLHAAATGVNQCSAASSQVEQAS